MGWFDWVGRERRELSAQIDAMNQYMRSVDNHLNSLVLLVCELKERLNELKESKLVERQDILLDNLQRFSGMVNELKGVASMARAGLKKGET